MPLIFGLCGPTGRMRGTRCDQPHSGGQVAHLDVTVRLDADVYPCSSKGNILQADR